MRKFSKKINPKVLKIGKLVFKIIFHYTDLLTDLMLIMQIYQISAEEFEKTGKTSEEINAFMSAETLILFLSLDRFMSYYDMLSMFKQKQLRDHFEKIGKNEKELTEREFLQQAESIKLPFLKKIQSAFLILTYSDYLFVAIYDFKSLEIAMTKKQMIELYCENMAFFDIGISVLEYQYIMTGKIDILVLFSMALSCLACCYVLYDSYINRSKEHVRFKDKEELQFALLPPKTKQFLAYPYTINFLKMYSPHINEYKDLFVESHFLEKEIQKKIEEKELNNMLTTEIHKRIKKEHKKNHLNYLEKFYLIINLIASIFGFCLVDMTHAWSKGAVDLMQTFSIAFLAYLPQFSVHVCLQIREAMKKGICALLKQIIIECLQMLFIPLLGTLMFLTPVKTEEIPLLRKTRENWMTNFFNSLYIMAIKMSYQIYCIIQVRTIIFDGSGVAYEGFSEEQIKNITNEDGLIRIFYEIGFWCFILQFVFNFMYLMECLYYNYLVQYKNQEPRLEQKQYENDLKNYLELLQKRSIQIKEIPSYKNISNQQKNSKSGSGSRSGSSNSSPSPNPSIKPQKDEEGVVDISFQQINMEHSQITDNTNNNTHARFSKVYSKSQFVNNNNEKDQALIKPQAVDKELNIELVESDELYQNYAPTLEENTQRNSVHNPSISFQASLVTLSHNNSYIGLPLNSGRQKSASSNYHPTFFQEIVKTQSSYQKK